MKGNNICVIAMNVPVILYMSSSLDSSAIIPSDTKVSLTTPCFCNKTIQLEVLTRRDVQKGNKTQIINKFE